MMDMPASFIPDPEPTCHHCHRVIETGAQYRLLAYQGEQHEFHVTWPEGAS